ncbi:L-type lectin-domain containing receptor kinase IV.2-like [Silene latifolia]|uniref:L-type lectin-domain containing receptor kinase IV.2-like n=1 Tax=Silene latifolia TaxID=37657 RepID=UPI003D76FABA
MNFKVLLLIFILCTFLFISFAQNLQHFTFNGFQQAKLRLDGGAIIHKNGLLQLTNTSKQLTTHAFFPSPLNYKSSSSFSFSITFVFAMFPEIQVISGHGIVFFISPSMDFHLGTPGKYFGLFNASTIGNSSNHLFAVELDTIQDFEFGDIDSNHVGIDINNLISNASASAGYFSCSEGINKTLNLIGAKPVQIWIDYDHRDVEVKVAMAPLGLSRPSKNLLSSRIDLSKVFLDSMYVGLASSTGSVASSHYVLGWNIKQGRVGQAPSLVLSKLPSLPRFGKRRRLSLGSKNLLIVVSIVLVMVGLVFYMRWRKKYEEIFDDWEKEYRVQRVSYKDLYKATKRFKEKELLGYGGFGKVYKGTLPSSKTEVAIKKVSHGSSQGMREFVAEIRCLGRLRHRDLVQLLGYCRRQGELVYDYMPNGSLDKYQYNEGKVNLSWLERVKIIRGVASALVYLHEEWEQLVIHRDVMSSNVLLDLSMNARLGDFGIARLYDHGTNPQTTHVVGTVGYLAPELSKKGKATTKTDVFSFGMFILEVASATSPTTPQGDGHKYPADWVYDCRKRGAISEVIDPRLEGQIVEQIELVLKLGMVCAHPRPEARPSMRRVMQILDRDTKSNSNAYHWTCSNLLGTLPYDARPVQSTCENETLPLFASPSKVISITYSTDSILTLMATLFRLTRMRNQTSGNMSCRHEAHRYHEDDQFYLLDFMIFLVVRILLYSVIIYYTPATNVHASDILVVLPLTDATDSIVSSNVDGLMNNDIPPMIPLTNAPVSEDLKPINGMMFSNLEDGIDFYNKYSKVCGFIPRLDSTKLVNGIVTHKRCVCNKEGKSRNKGTKKEGITRTGCEAKVSFKRIDTGEYQIYDFVEVHTHARVTPATMVHMKPSRNLNLFHKKMIMDNSRVNHGPVDSFRMFKEYVKGYKNVGASLEDFKNFSRDVKKYIKEYDAEMLLETFMQKKAMSPSFYFDFEMDDEKRLSKVFWADPISIKNYALFGEAVSFDATYNFNEYKMVFCPFTSERKNPNEMLMRINFDC